MNEFLQALETFIQITQSMPRFRGQAQAVTALRRVQNLAVFNRKVSDD